MSRVVAFSAVAVVLAAAFAIVVHAALPAPVDAIAFDSALVELVGFPVVAVSYFLALFAHCAVVVIAFGRRSTVPRLATGYRFGVAFAVLYLVGMQEVVVEASPFATWGFDFVAYQFFMGVGDALPVFLLCTSIAYVSLATSTRSAPERAIGARSAAVAVAAIASTSFVQRTIGHATGLVDSNIATYPVQTLVWTALFGAALGGATALLYPVFAGERRALAVSVRLVVLTLGVNWMVFNGFIGLIFSGVMPQMLLRSGVDVAVAFLTSLVVLRYLRPTDGNDGVTPPP